jgi:general secretion pathway protein L
MSWLFSAVSLQFSAATLSDLLDRVRQWWMREFLALFPERTAKWLAGRDKKSLVLVAERDTISFQLLDDLRQPVASQSISRAQYSFALVDKFLQTHGLERNLAIGVRLPREKFFCRKLILPAEASRPLDDIVVHDLIAKTPFRPDDIHCDYVAARAVGGDKIIVLQWVVRRDFIKDAVASLSVDPARLAFIDAACDHHCGPSPVISMRRDDGRGRPWPRKAAAALACCAMALAVFILWLRYSQQQSKLDDLKAQVAAVKLKAASVRTAIEKLEQKQAILLRLRLQKTGQPGLLDTWDEATRILPAHSWLTELRLSEPQDKQEQQVTMTGFSAAGSSLVALVDRSPLFFDVSLAAPIALDSVEQRERFALQAKLKRHDPIKAAAR